MADTINATCYGGIDVPLEDFSDAKLGFNPETSKLFAIFFLFLLKKQRDAGSNSNVSFVLSFYKNYVTSRNWLLVLFYWHN